MTLDEAITEGVARCASGREDGGHGSRVVSLVYLPDGRCVDVETTIAGPVVRLVRVAVDGRVTDAETARAGLAPRDGAWVPTRARAARRT
jgi:hypothetical protein